MTAEWRNGLNGYLKVSVSGYSTERFLNLMKAGGIEVHQVTCRGTAYEFLILPRDFLKLKPLVRKAGVKVRILRKSGAVFAVRRYQKRIWYFIGCILFFLCLYSLSFFVWRIEFQGNEKFTDEYLTKYLSEEGVQAGILKSRISCEALEDQIREDFQEINWVSAQITGTCLSVRVKENEVLLYVPEKKDEPCDLIAKKDGVITQMMVRSGVPIVKAGDTVEKGQVLVAGSIPITNDGDEVIAVNPVRADADVYAETERTDVKTVSRISRGERETGRKRYGVYLDFFGHRFAYILPAYGENLWKTMRRENQLRLTEDFYLPVRWGAAVSREYETYDRFLGNAELEALAERWMQEEMEKLEEKGIQILTNNVKIKVNDSVCQMRMQLKTEERIAEEAAISPGGDSEDIQIKRTGEADERN